MKLITPVATLVVLTTCSLVGASAEETNATEICSGITCERCLRQKNCVWIHGGFDGRCAEDCVRFPDVNCYYPPMFGSPLTNRFEICEVAKDLHADNKRCFRQTDKNTCRTAIGCAWLNGMQKSGNEAFWCSLRLESAITHQHKKKTDPPTEPPMEVAIQEDDHIEDDLREVHASTTSVMEAVLGFYCVLPFCFWGCWWLSAYLRKMNGYEHSQV